MPTFFPVGYFPASYFTDGYFGEDEASGGFADAALLAVAGGTAVLSPDAAAAARLNVAGAGVALLASSVAGEQVPETPQGGASGGFGAVWREAALRRFATGGLAVAGRGSAVLSAAADVGATLRVVSSAQCGMSAVADAAPGFGQGPAGLAWDNDYWLLAA